MSMSKSDHTTEAERLVRQCKNDVDNLYEKYLDPEHSMSDWHYETQMELIKVRLRVAQVHATLAESMRV